LARQTGWIALFRGVLCADHPSRGAGWTGVRTANPTKQETGGIEQGGSGTRRENADLMTDQAAADGRPEFPLAARTPAGSGPGIAGDSSAATSGSLPRWRAARFLLG
jgi:hypothetical protein